MTGPRSLLFKKPAWAAPSKPASTTENAPAFGEQHVYEEIIAEDKKKRAQREARRRERAEKETRKFTDGSAEPAAKKRRLSEDDLDDSDSSNDNDLNSAESTPKQAKTPEFVEPKRITRGTPTKQKQLLPGLDDQPSRQAKPAPASVINLDDDEPHESDINSAGWLKKKVAVDPDDEEDPFMRELQRKVLEKARLRQLAKDEGDQASPSETSSVQSPSAENATSGLLQSASPHVEGATPKIPDVQIFVMTSIPGTRDLIVNRHSSQTLQKVREYFCERFKLEPAFARNVFFAWRGTKLYNSSTAEALIKILKREAGIDPSSDEDPSNGKIHIEAVTQEILDERQQAKAKAKAAATRRAEQEDDLIEEAAPPVEPKEKVVINLVAPNVETLQLSVRPSTKVAKIMRAFKAHRDVNGAKTYWLVFDGERLDENATAESVGLEDGDNVEVHPR
jgi:hypothetical protein